MFTGIAQGLFKVSDVQKRPGLTRYSVELSSELLKGLALGASVSVDGVCQTVVEIQDRAVYFDAIQETLNRTTLDTLAVDRQLNIERAAKFGDEIGGHNVSGHIYGKVQIERIDRSENNYIVTLRCLPEWNKYLFSKGYIALDGVSLTLVDVNPVGTFTVHLIPETLRVTTFGFKRVGDWVNIEFDSQTQAVVDTVERVLASKRLG